MQKLRSSFIVLAMKNIKKNGDDIEVIRNLEQAGKSCQLLNRFANDAGIRLDAAGEYAALAQSTFDQTSASPSKRIEMGAVSLVRPKRTGKLRGGGTWISICRRGPNSGENDCNRFSIARCCRDTAPGSNRRPSGANPLRLWAICRTRRGPRDCGIWVFPNSAPTSRERGLQISNTPRLRRSWGGLFWAPEVFNCQAPDVPNMIALQNCATAEQKQRWLRPLLEAQTRSAFGMTEPDVASSDATNIATTIARDGDDYVVSGRKWFITGAAHPRCSFLIVLGVTNPEAERTSRHSCVIVPMDAPGVRLVRPLRWMGCEDHIAPIGELAFDNVRVPRSNLLGEEGEGFKVAQVRLGPARIHHCMRSIGLCELLIELMMVRSAERSAFGRTVNQYDTVQRWIAESRVELEQARLLTYRCAWRLDQAGHHGAWRDVSLIKVAVPAMLQRIADRAMQVFGAMGGSDDTPDPSGAGVGTPVENRRRSR